ncbi:MAG: 23S rRNA (adenine(1618)-N(6))-methyltransferase RlmF, partial [Bacteroidia bacterium]
MIDKSKGFINFGQVKGEKTYSMLAEKSNLEKTRLHIRNKNRERYDLAALIIAIPELTAYIKPNKYGGDSVDFTNPIAVKLLNRALLSHYYGVKHWEFPDENLCPPIPGRADYLHYIADLLVENNSGIIPKGDKITCLDVGVGANCIYPIIGVTEYDWKFIGSDVDPKSIKSAQHIVAANPSLTDKVECRIQKKKEEIFYGIIGKEEKIDCTICNPPFHSSSQEAQKSTQRKVMNLSGKRTKIPTLNFAGINHELIFEGGEYMFIRTMVMESKRFAKNCLWFSTLVSKSSNLKEIYKVLEEMNALQVKTIPMETGNKS